MKRSLLVVAGTAAGVTAVVSYHATTATSASQLGSVTPAAPRASSASAGETQTSRDQAAATAAHTTSTATTGSAAETATSSHTTTSTPASTPTTPKPATKSAVGEAVSFQYGQLQVRVTERAGKITKVAIASFQISDQHSVSIDEYAVPRLEQEVVAAQSAHIDGISGASYTSQAYEQSVQSALDKL